MTAVTFDRAFSRTTSAPSRPRARRRVAQARSL